jgi:hypothetical protein
MYKCKQRWHYNFKISILFYSIRSAGAIRLQRIESLSHSFKGHANARWREACVQTSAKRPRLLLLPLAGWPPPLSLRDCESGRPRACGKRRAHRSLPRPSPLSLRARTREPTRGQAHPVRRILGALRAPLIAPHPSAPSPCPPGLSISET